MPSCIAKNCNNRRENKLRMFVFPRNEKRRKIWLQNCGNNRVTHTSRLCEVHFEESQFELRRLDGWRKLKPNAIPTIFSHNKAEESASKSDEHSANICLFHEKNKLATFVKCNKTPIIEHCVNIKNEVDVDISNDQLFILENTDYFHSKKDAEIDLINNNGFTGYDCFINIKSDKDINDNNHQHTDKSNYNKSYYSWPAGGTHNFRMKNYVDDESFINYDENIRKDLNTLTTVDKSNQTDEDKNAEIIFTDNKLNEKNLSGQTDEIISLNKQLKKAYAQIKFLESMFDSSEFMKAEIQEINSELIT